MLIIGGRGQGKLDYVLERYGIAREAVSHELDEAPVIYGLHEIIKTMVAAGEDPLVAVTAHGESHPDTIYICDEVGSGVVPLDPGQREWREAVGRCCCVLAKQAHRVERVFCGLPLVLKDEVSL